MERKKKSTFGDILRRPSYHLVPGHYYTNTWKGRRVRHLERLENTLYDWGLRDVTVREFGPGGVAIQFADRLPEFDEEDIEAKKRNWSKILNFRETRARNKEDSILTCFEPVEICNILGRRVGISKLEVVDKYDKVLEGVRNLGIPVVVTRKHDLDVDRPYHMPPVDVGVAFNVEGYASNMNAVYNCRFLAINPVAGNVVIPGFTMLKKGIYLKGERPDKMKDKSIVWTHPNLNEDEIVRKSMGVEGPYSHKI